MSISRFDSLKGVKRPFLCKCIVNDTPYFTYHPNGFEYENDICKKLKCPISGKQERCWVLLHPREQVKGISRRNSTEILDCQPWPSGFIQAFNLKQINKKERGNEYVCKNDSKTDR